MPDKRLIDANELVDKVSLDWGLTHQNQLISATTKLATADAMCKLLGEAAKCQTIDAVEVVRCKECAGRKKNKFCIEWLKYVPDDGFCHMGEKMDGGAEGV